VDNLRVLFLGGTGVISSAASGAAIARGMRLTTLNRGKTDLRPAPAGAKTLTADLRDEDSVRKALGRRRFDVVVDFVAFTPEHVQRDIELFEGRTGHYVFISSTSVYQKPPLRLPITESTPLRNPFWQYARDKIACEELLVTAYRERGFPMTIVRPAHTYDATTVPLTGGWTALERMRRGAPVVVPGDGTSLWTLMHSRDFAEALVGLLGNPQAIGDSVHITSDEVLTWDQITRYLAEAAGVKPEIVHITSDTIAAADPELGARLLGNRSHSTIFDNSKIKALVPGFMARTPFSTGAQEVVEWYAAHPERQTADRDLGALFDRLVEASRFTSRR
jgi:nucleoside-diphosphate-sugar epimerase